MKDKNFLSNVDVVLFALYKSGGLTKKIHTEYVAWEAFQLAKDKFSWSLPEFRAKNFPDKTAARYALESAIKVELVSGRAGKDFGGKESEGWRFTPKGAKWILDNLDRISKSLNVKTIVSDQMPQHMVDRFLKTIRTEKIYKDFLINKTLVNSSAFDFTDMLHCSPDAPKNVKKQKFLIMKTTANAINDEELHSFLSACEERFSEIVDTKDL